MFEPAFTESESDIFRIFEMTWEDYTPFIAVQRQFNLDESSVLALMRGCLKLGLFKTHLATHLVRAEACLFIGESACKPVRSKVVKRHCARHIQHAPRAQHKRHH